MLTRSELTYTLLESLFMVAIMGNIFVKAGYSRWYSVLLAVPMVNLVAILWFAFSKWPIEEELQNIVDERSKLTTNAEMHQ